MTEVSLTGEALGPSRRGATPIQLVEVSRFAGEALDFANDASTIAQEASEGVRFLHSPFICSTDILITIT